MKSRALVVSADLIQGFLVDCFKDYVQNEDHPEPANDGLTPEDFVEIIRHLEDLTK